MTFSANQIAHSKQSKSNLL